ncbi:MAG: hypothetical protein IKQ06_00700 [Bacilli bacterium]|nr:hypothetical protein [Bacilli bacterium]MBR6136653.1 hypothetical protein [Bacilli bacterium]
MARAMKEGLKTGLVILAIYILFVLYLLFVSDRVEKLDARSSEEQTQITLKIGK